MTVEPIRVVVVIRPDDPASETNWRSAVMAALLRDGALIREADFTCEAADPQPDLVQAKAERRDRALARWGRPSHRAETPVGQEPNWLLMGLRASGFDVDAS